MNQLILKAIFNLLQDSDLDVRWNAIEAVGKLGKVAATPEILQALADMLQDSNVDIRNVVIYTLKILDENLMQEKIELLLKDPDCRNVVELIGELGSAVVTSTILKYLASMLQDSDVRNIVVITLGKLGKVAATPEILQALADMLQDSDVNVRVDVINTMIYLDQIPNILQSVVLLLKDSNFHVKVTGLQIVKKLGDRAETPEILQALVCLLYDLSEFIRNQAVTILGCFSLSSTIIKDLLPLLQDLDMEVRNSAIYTVAKLGHYAPETIPIILEYFTSMLNNSDGKISAIYVLEKLYNLTPDIFQTLILFCQDSDPNVRKTVAEVLYYFDSHPLTNQVFVDLLQDYDPEVRRRTVQIVGNLGLLSYFAS